MSTLINTLKNASFKKARFSERYQIAFLYVLPIQLFMLSRKQFILTRKAK